MAIIMNVIWALMQLVLSVLVIAVVWLFVWYMWLEEWWLCRKAKKVIIPWVESYKKRCTAQNRFVVTVETLQDSFREFDTPTIEKVWRVLIEKRLIQQDPMDNEWCIR